MLRQRLQNGTDEAEGVMNRPVNAMVNFWTWHSAGCRHIHHLSCLQLGIDPDGSSRLMLTAQEKG